MDATDHENIPSPNHGTVYSNLIHTGFDYLNQDKHGNTQKSSEQAYSSVPKALTDSAKNYPDVSEKYKPLGWFYKNLFPEEQHHHFKKVCVVENKECVHTNENQSSLQSYKHSPHKKYILSNFDLNALSPNSW